mgnify:CR=1 FL=1
MDSNPISNDEKEILDGWRLVKRPRKGHMLVTLKSDGTQYYLEITPAKEGRIKDLSEK